MLQVRSHHRVRCKHNVPEIIMNEKHQDYKYCAIALDLNLTGEGHEIF